MRPNVCTKEETNRGMHAQIDGITVMRFTMQIKLLNSTNME